MGIPIINMQPKPSFGEAAGMGISQGLAQLLGQHREQKKNRQALSGLAPLFEELGIAPEKIDLITRSGLSPDIAVKALETTRKARGEMAEEGKLKQIGQEAFDTMSNILKKGNLGRTSKVRGFFGGETGEDVGAFQSATGALESMLVDMVSRGTLSNARFKYITETLLPKPDDTEAAIRGKMKALAPMLGLSAESLLGKKEKEMPAQARRARDPKTGRVIEWTGSGWRDVE